MRIASLPANRSSRSFPTTFARQPRANDGVWLPAEWPVRQVIQSRTSSGEPTRPGARSICRHKLPSAEKRNCPKTESRGLFSLRLARGHSCSERVRACWMAWAILGIWCRRSCRSSPRTAWIRLGSAVWRRAP